MTGPANEEVRPSSPSSPTGDLHPIEDVFGWQRPRGFVEVDLPASAEVQRNLRGLARYHQTNYHQSLSDMLHYALLHTPQPDGRTPYPRRSSPHVSFLVSPRVAELIEQSPQADCSRSLQRYLLWLVQRELQAIGNTMECLCGCGGRIHPFLDKRGRPRWVLNGHGYFLRDDQRPRERRVLGLLQTEGPLHLREIAAGMEQDPASVRVFLCELSGLGLLRRVERGVYDLPQ